MGVKSSRVEQMPGQPLQQPSNGASRLSGGKRRIARTIYLAAILFMIAAFAVAVPVRQADLARTFEALSPAQSLILEELGVSADEHSRLVLAIEIIVPTLFLAIGLLIVRRKPGDWVALQTSAGMFSYSIWVSPPLNALGERGLPWSVPVLAIEVYAMTSVLLFLYMFPDGRLVPRYARGLMGLWGLWAIGWVLLPGSLFDLSDIFTVSLASFLALMAWLATGVGAQLYRYFRVATPVHRQQTKLVIFGSTFAVIGYLVFGFNRFAASVIDAPRHASVVYDLIGVPLFLVSTLAIPISFAVSILRYRLWDIDLVINRVIVYATLTAILGGMYSAMITFSQRVFVALTGERSDAAIVITVLVVGATFTYLKGKLQSTVDRYVKPVPDPIRDLQSFGEQVRKFIDLVDVERLARRALDESAGAFRAGSGAVYLMRDGRFQLVHNHGEWTQVEGMSAWLESGADRYGWIALGPRKEGTEYTDEDRRTLQDIASLTARTISLVKQAGFGPPTVDPAGRRDVAGSRVA